MAYLTTHSVGPHSMARNDRMINELGRMWKEAVVAAPRPVMDLPSLLSSGFKGLFPCWSSFRAGGRGHTISPVAKIDYSHTSALPYIIAWRLIKHTDNFTFYSHHFFTRVLHNISHDPNQCEFWSHTSSLPYIFTKIPLKYWGRQHKTSVSDITKLLIFMLTKYCGNIIS
jgi:hypothetical protein